MSVRAASSHNMAETKYDMLVSSMNIIALNSLYSTRAYHLRIDLAHDATVGERSISKKILRSRKIYLLEAYQREGRVCLRTLVDRKRKRLVLRLM